MNDIPAPPRPTAIPAASDTWAIMEARLKTAKIDDLLEKAAAQLGTLAHAKDLPQEIAAAVADTLEAVETGRRRIGSARQRLRACPATAGTAPPPAPLAERPSEAATTQDQNTEEMDEHDRRATLDRELDGGDRAPPAERDRPAARSRPDQLCR
jgi:hypothetical protein